MGDDQAALLEVIERRQAWLDLERSLARVEVLDACRWCSSRFLKACTVPGVLICRTCGRVIVLGRREAAPAEFASGVVTTIRGRDDLPPGWRIASRWTARGLQCEQLVQQVEEG